MVFRETMFRGKGLKFQTDPWRAFQPSPASKKPPAKTAVQSSYDPAPVMALDLPQHLHGDADGLLLFKE